MQVLLSRPGRGAGGAGGEGGAAGNTGEGGKKSDGAGVEEKGAQLMKGDQSYALSDLSVGGRLGTFSSIFANRFVLRLIWFV